MIISIDGPTASGKSTTAKLLAEKLGFDYLATGYLYRALAYILIHSFGYKPDELKDPNREDLQKILASSDFQYTYIDGNVVLRYKCENIAPFLKTAQIDDWSSIISSNKNVRSSILEFQRNYAANHNTIVEGRDIGTVIFPHADYKFYLTASLEERARRWQALQQQQGNIFTLSESMEHVSTRDARDRNRKVSPFVIPEDAIIVDDTDATKEETVAKILSYINSN